MSAIIVYQSSVIGFGIVLQLFFNFGKFFDRAVTINRAKETAETIDKLSSLCCFIKIRGISEHVKMPVAGWTGIQLLQKQLKRSDISDKANNSVHLYLLSQEALGSAIG